MNGFSSVSSGVLLAQLAFLVAQSSSDDGSAAAAGIAIVSVIIGLIITIVVFAVNIALGLWVMRDAKRRHATNGTLFGILTIVFGIVPWLIYLFTRPKTPGTI